MASNTGDTTPAQASDPAATTNALVMMTAAQAAPLPLSAGSRVASIPELLEMILLNLSPTTKPLSIDRTDADDFPHLNTLLSSQITSQAFRNTVKDSPKLQRVLFDAKVRKQVEKFTKEFKETWQRSIPAMVEKMRREFGLR